MSLLLILIQIAVIILLADFASGLIHWAEDAYGHEGIPVIGPLVIKPNLIHHKEPRAFLKKSWWQSSWDLVLLGALVLGVAALLGCLSWQLALFIALGVNANQIHKWAHKGPRENNVIVRWLQKARVLQTPQHHADHHRGMKNSNYCAITNFVNPVLDNIRFWHGLERLIFKVFGLRRRPDPTVRIGRLTH